MDYHKIPVDKVAYCNRVEQMQVWWLEYMTSPRSLIKRRIKW